MVDLITSIIDSLIFILPAFFANASPTILGKGSRFNAPIDLYRFWRGEKEFGRILGDGKTIRGFIGGTFAGTVMGGIINPLGNIMGVNIEYVNYLSNGLFYNLLNIQELNPSIIMLFGLLAGFLQSFGALIGDLVGSFIKRRKGLKRGESFLFMDQLGFLIAAMLFVWIVVPWPIEWLIFLIPITFITHIIMNLLGYIVGIQKVPL